MIARLAFLLLLAMACSRAPTCAASSERWNPHGVLFSHSFADGGGTSIPDRYSLSIHNVTLDAGVYEYTPRGDDGSPTGPTKWSSIIEADTDAGHLLASWELVKPLKLDRGALRATTWTWRGEWGSCRDDVGESVRQAEQGLTDADGGVVVWSVLSIELRANGEVGSQLGLPLRWVDCTDSTSGERDVALELGGTTVRPQGTGDANVGGQALRMRVAESRMRSDSCGHAAFLLGTPEAIP